MLFGKGRTTIAEHIQNVFKEGELDEKVVCRYFRHTAQYGAIEGKTQDKEVKHYNLDVIISGGYRRDIRTTTKWLNKNKRAKSPSGFLNSKNFKQHSYENFPSPLRRNYCPCCR